MAQFGILGPLGVKKLGTLDSWYDVVVQFGHGFGMQDFMRRLGVDLLIQPEEDVSEAKETDQIQQRAVVR